MEKLNSFHNPSLSAKRSSPNKRQYVKESGGKPTNASRQSEKTVLIDCDAGADDAWAIFLSLYTQRNPSGPAFNVVGITTQCGNTTLDFVANNVTRTLNTVNDTTTPIYRGMENPMISRFAFLEETPWFGEDGFGDANLPPIPTRVESEHAVDAIIRLVQTYRGQLTIVCLGPLTNLAIALKLKPAIKNEIKEVYILGGTVFGEGNATATAEYNFLVDPEAAKVVLEELSPCPIVILPWETVKNFGTSTHEFRTETLGTLGTPEIELMNRVEALILDRNKTSWTAADAVAVACLINPDVIKAQQDYVCSVELNGSLTRGMMVVDKVNNGNKIPNAKVILEVDLALYESMLIAAVEGGSPTNQHSSKRPRKKFIKS